MTASDIFLIVSTMIIGGLCGAWLYQTAFVPEYVENQEIAEIKDEQARQLTVFAEQYGGCNMIGSCPSFSLKANREYRYERDGELFQGKLPRELFKDLKRTLGEEKLKNYTTSVPEQQRNCTFYADGIDYSYDISIQDTAYAIDTCDTQFSNQTALGEALLSIWSYMADPT